MKKAQKTKRNKVLVSIALVAASAMYILSQYVGNTSAVASNVPTPVAQTTTTAKPVATKKTTSGQYADGTYTGTPTNAYYGTVQVQAVVQNGKLASVQFLQYASDRSTSVSINNYAMPILKSEAIQAQSSNVNMVSGATFTSQAFQQSLASALAQA
jgi:uncharacterized protein with FMN-binding domain